MSNFKREVIVNRINELFENTDENHFLLIPDLSDASASREEGDFFLSCEMNWKEKDIDTLKQECINHIGLIETAAEDEDFSHKNKENEDFCNKFLCPFDDNYDIGNIESPESVEGKLFLGEDLTEDEEEIYKKYSHDLRLQATARLGDNDFSYHLIIRSLRLFKLIKLHAPEVVISNEIKRLTDAFVLYKHCTYVMQIEGIHA